MSTLLPQQATSTCRANARFALARILAPPREWEDSLPELVDTGLADLPEPLPELGGRLAGRIADLGQDTEQVSLAHARAFLGPFEILVAPWASFYLEDEPKLMGPVSQYAARAYADAELAPGSRLLDAPDHVTHELEFMYFLAFNQATTGEAEWTQKYDRFWREHLGRWLPRFADALMTADVHPLYNTIAQALKLLCTLENDRSQIDSLADDAGGQQMDV